MVPFEGSCISLAKLHDKIPESWPDWDPKGKRLGCTFVDGLFETRQGEYPKLPFELNKKIMRNHWLSDTFADTEKMMSSYELFICNVGRCADARRTDTRKTPHSTTAVWRTREQADPNRCQ
jgi:hypothetical protein